MMVAWLSLGPHCLVITWSSLLGPYNSCVPSLLHISIITTRPLPLHAFATTVARSSLRGHHSAFIARSSLCGHHLIFIAWSSSFLHPLTAACLYCCMFLAIAHYCCCTPSLLHALTTAQPSCLPLPLHCMPPPLHAPTTTARCTLHAARPAPAACCMLHALATAVPSTACSRCCCTSLRCMPSPLHSPHCYGVPSPHMLPPRPSTALPRLIVTVFLHHCVICPATAHLRYNRLPLPLCCMLSPLHVLVTACLSL